MVVPSEKRVRLFTSLLEEPDFPENILKRPQIVGQIIGLCSEGVTISILTAELIKEILSIAPDSLEFIVEMLDVVLDCFEVTST